jgi:hypothetical protein
VTTVTEGLIFRIAFFGQNVVIKRFKKKKKKLKQCLNFILFFVILYEIINDWELALLIKK